MLFTLWRTPFWARADGGRGGSPSMYSFAPNLVDWSDFVTPRPPATPARSTPTADGPLAPLPLVSKWEMWNEPNYIGALRPQRIGTRVVSPAIYAGILNAGYTAISEVERAFSVQMDVLGGSMNRGFGGDGSIPALNFLRGMKEAKAKFDIASLHPYPLTGRAGMTTARQSPNITLTNYQRLREGARQALARQAATRCGSPSTARSPQPDRYGASLKARPRSSRRR